MLAPGSYTATLPSNATYQLPWCANGQSWQFGLDARQSPYYFPGTTVPIDTWLWEVPAGWRVLSAANGSVLSPDAEGHYPTSYPHIWVVPIDGDGGNPTAEVRVGAYNRACEFQTTGYNVKQLVSNYQRLTIRREPTLTITTPAFSVYCGDTQARTLTATLNQPAGTVVEWSATNG